MLIENIGAETFDDQKHKIMTNSKKCSFFSRFGCMRLNEDIPVSEKPDVAGSFDVEAASYEKQPAPTHLVVMVNGIIGSAQNWRYAAKKFVQAYPIDVIVHCSESNSLMSTLDGVDVMGKRLADEVISVATRHPSLQKISFIGHSLGGLVSRYAIAVLYQQDFTITPSEINGECGEQLNKSLVKEERHARIAGLEPANFITVATPHLGSRGHKQVPMFFGFRMIEKAAVHASGFLGRTGKHLFLSDNDNGKPPLLLQMSSDCEDLKFISTLQSFKRRVVYANARFDYIVGWSSSSLRPRNELPKRGDLVKHDKYKHIFKEETWETDNLGDLTKVGSGKSSEMEETMLGGLRRLSWERDVNFGGSIQRLLAHTTIQVKTYAVNSHGAHVIRHMISNFLLC